MPIEFFVCPCPGTGRVILDGRNEGPNKDDTGEHKISLQCSFERTCQQSEVTIIIAGTDPIEPKEVPFQCA